MSRRWGPGVLIAALLLSTTWPPAVQAAQQKWRYLIRLKSGATIEADSARATDGQVEYESDGGKVSIPRSTVERIEKIPVVEPSRPTGPASQPAAGALPGPAPPVQPPVAAPSGKPEGGVVAAITEKIRSIAGGLLGRTETGGGQEAPSAGAPTTEGSAPAPEGMEDVRTEAQAARQKLEAQAREREKISMQFVGTFLLVAGGVVALFLLKFLWNILFGRAK